MSLNIDDVFGATCYLKYMLQVADLTSRELEELALKLDEMAGSARLRARTTTLT